MASLACLLPTPSTPVLLLYRPAFIQDSGNGQIKSSGSSLASGPLRRKGCARHSRVRLEHPGSRGSRGWEAQAVTARCPHASVSSLTALLQLASSHGVRDPGTLGCFRSRLETRGRTPLGSAARSESQGPARCVSRALWF